MKVGEVKETTDQALGASTGQSGSLQASSDAETVYRVPLREEELVAQTHTVQVGVVRLRKAVTAEEQTLSVPVMREEVMIEHIPADQFDPQAPLDPDVQVIPIYEERLVVATRTFISEYMLVRKKRHSEQQDVRGTVRCEELTVREADPNGE
jgi:uncharacterized protein (TIGR02271 family)